MNLQDGYAGDWFKLDNAGKLFPCTSKKYDTKVFRFACELKYDINGEILQKALDQTMEVFPYYRSVLKKGLFWYYLEESHLVPVVTEENSAPCSPIFNPQARNLLFNVTYYKRRISVEFFHSLTDGTGAMDFLKTLVYNYIAAAFKDELGDDIPPSDHDMSVSQSVSDSFQKYYRNDKKIVRKKELRAYKIRGEKNPDFRLGIIEGTLETKSVIDLAHKYNTTVTVFLISLLILQIGREMAEIHKIYPVVVSVPVNLRNYFDSGSSRNFFAVIKVSYSFRTGKGTLEDIIETVRQSFKVQLERDNIADIMNRYTSLEHKFYMRIVPLPLKTLSIKIANKISEKYVTFAFSNLSVVKMPEKIKEYIHGFNVFFSTEKLQICMCSFEDKMTISFTSPFSNNSIQQRFFRELSAMGVKTVIAFNNVGKNTANLNTGKKENMKKGDSH